jgi:hypothetical protein
MESTSTLQQTIHEEKSRLKKDRRMQEEEDAELSDVVDSDEEEDSGHAWAEECAENAVEALYSSSGRSVTDVLDYHLNKMCKILLTIQKQQRESLG